MNYGLMLFAIENLPNNNFACLLYLRNVDSPTRKYLAVFKLLEYVVTLFVSTFVIFIETDFESEILFLIITL